MTPRMNSNTADEAVELLMNAAMVIERSAYLGAGHYERPSNRFLLEYSISENQVGSFSTILHTT